MKKHPRLRVGILGATGMVGQRLVSLLADHPWFELVVVAASPASAGKTYRSAVAARWSLEQRIPVNVGRLVVLAVEQDMAQIIDQVEIVFCALDMEKGDIRRIEEQYASLGAAVISNNSAHRWSEDVPMLIPEINPGHAKLIKVQQKRRGWKRGFIVVKPNCSIQAYVAVLTALAPLEPTRVEVCSLQAVSGAGRTLTNWGEMVDNVIPFIPGEEEKSMREPGKIWGTLAGDKIELAVLPVIGATCIRVPVSDGHLSSVGVDFAKKTNSRDILKKIKQFGNPLSQLKLPSSPDGNLITYIDQQDRPQTKLDRTRDHGMGITMGRLRPGVSFDWQFVALSHNTIRGAAGGSVLSAELLTTLGYIQPK